MDPWNPSAETNEPLENAASTLGESAERLEEALSAPLELPEAPFLPIAAENQEFFYAPNALDEPIAQTPDFSAPIEAPILNQDTCVIAPNNDFGRTAQYDPLTDAEQLPSLFPNQPQPAPIETPIEASEPATIVPRPQRKNNRTVRMVSRICISVVKWLVALLLAVAILAAGLVGYLTVTEYSPAAREKAQRGTTQVEAKFDGTQTVKVVTFNTGYGGLGEDADFFMDGGDGVTPESKKLVKENMIGIERILSDIDADFIFLQEVDTDSKRSYEMNQWRQYEYDLEEYETAFALNYSCELVPYPLNDFIGKVNSGIATYSRFNIDSATRVSLPNNFTWPVRVANLKRCLLITRHKLPESDKELVMINCHLEAYDDGKAKQEQTAALFKLMQEEYSKGNYVVVGGDFNQSFPGGAVYPVRDADNWKPGKLPNLPNGWQYAYDETTPTSRLLDRAYNPRTTQHYVIDGFIVSPNVRVTKITTLDEGFVYSDHNPVVMEFELGA